MASKRWFSTNEWDVIRELEIRIGRKLEQVDIENQSKTISSYAVDADGHIIGLSLPGRGFYDISFLKELINLKQLYLIGNVIPDISILKNLTNLTKLDFRYNRIKEISTLKNLLSLKELDLSYNQISDISILKDLKRLERLNLEFNKISQLPDDIVKWDSNLEIKWDYQYSGQHGIFLEGNPLATPPVEIVKLGKESIRAYFKSLEGEKRTLNEVKLLLVGDGGAGKTSLVKRMLGERFDMNESQTHGINIDYLDVKSGKEKIRVRIWDFGGQEIMHATHQFFLSKRSLYVLVLDCRKDDKTEYWLKHIQSFGGVSAVLIAINKIDENPGFDVNRLFLQQKYENIKGFYRISCATGEGFEAFFQRLIEELTKVEFIHTIWGTNWFRVKTYLETMSKDFISYDEYNELCEKENIHDQIGRDTLVDYLNDLGVILHFKDFDLQETHVLNPEWVTSAVYKIINSKKVADAKGLLKLNLLGDILKEDNYYYPRDKYRYIIELMKKFELCFQVDHHTILIPDLLEIQEPAFEFDYITALKFHIDYDFLPKSIMARFIVKMHRDIKHELNWRTGVVLEDRSYGCNAVVKADNEAKRIYIYVQGEQKRDYFSSIRKTFKDINESFEKLETIEQVPLPGYDEKSVRYTELVGLEKMDKSEYICGELGKSFSVSGLLNGIEKKEDRMNQRLLDGNISIDIKPHLEFKHEHNVNIETTQISQQSHTVVFDINNLLPTLQDDFSAIKDLIAKHNPALVPNLKEIMDSLDDVNSKTSKEKFNKPLNKLSRFLRDLGDKNTDMHKIVSGAKKGIEIAKKLVKTYNKFSQWIPGLPVVPDVFLKD